MASTGYLTLSTGAPILATRLISGLTQLARVLAAPRGQELLRDLWIVSMSGHWPADQPRQVPSDDSLRVLREMKVLDRDGLPCDDLDRLVRAAIRGQFPSLSVDGHPYPDTDENDQAMAWALDYVNRLLDASSADRRVDRKQSQRRARLRVQAEAAQSAVQRMVRDASEELPNGQQP